MGRVFGVSRGGLGNLGSLRVGVELPIKPWNKNYGKISDDVKKYPKTTDKALDRADKAWEKHAGSIKKASLGMVAFGTVTTAALGFAVKAAGDFQQSMTNTQAIAGATSEELKQLTSFAREMGKQTVFSAKESADAMLDLASAGLSTQEIMDSLRGTMNLAAATQADLSFSASLVVGNLKAFDLAASESGRLANLFTAAISGSRATMDKLATSMAIIGPVAASINMPIEETVGLLGKLFDRNIDASTSGTALRQAIAQLLKPSEDAKEALGRLRISVRNADDSMRPLVDIIRDLENASLNTTDALAIFGVRAGPAMLALVNAGADSIEAFTEKITGTEKAAEVAAQQVDTFKGQMKILNSALSELKITIGNELLPVLTDYTTKLSGIINKTSDWAAENPKLTKTLVTLGGAAGVTALALGGIGLAAPGIIAAGKVLKPVGRDIGLLGAAAGGATIKFTALGAALATAGSIALAGGSIWWAYRRIVKATNEEVDRTALRTNILSKSQENLSRAVEDIGIELREFEGKGLLPANATLGDLNINIGKLNRVLGTTFQKTTNAELAVLALERGLSRTTIEVNKSAVALETLGPPAELATDQVARLTKEIEALEAQAGNLGESIISGITVPVTEITTTIERERGRAVGVWITRNDEISDELADHWSEMKSIALDGVRALEVIEGGGLAGSQKTQDRAALDSLGTLQKTEKKKINIVTTGNEVVKKIRDDGSLHMEVATDLEIREGERRGNALVAEREREDKQLKAAEISWQGFGDTVIGVFANVTRTNRIFQDTWIGSLTQWGIENRKILTSISDVWSGRADSIIGSATSIFGTMVGLIDSLADARRQANRQESAERASRVARTAELRGLSFREAARLERELTAGLTEEEREAARARGPARRGTRVGRAAQERFPFPGAIPTGGIQFITPPAQPITIDQPPTFIPRRPQGTDRFGRPVAATVTMAPGRGNVTHTGDNIFNIIIPEGSDIQNMDSAEWERVLRDNIQPAAEAIGLRFARSDNLLAS